MLAFICWLFSLYPVLVDKSIERSRLITDFQGCSELDERIHAKDRRDFCGEGSDTPDYAMTHYFPTKVFVKLVTLQSIPLVPSDSINPMLVKYVSQSPKYKPVKLTWISTIIQALRDTLGFYGIKVVYMIVMNLSISVNWCSCFWGSILLIESLKVAKHSYQSHMFGAVYILYAISLKADGCSSPVLTAIDFEDGIPDTCPEYWWCEDVAETRLYSGYSAASPYYYYTPDGDFMFIIGTNNQISKAISEMLVLPNGIDHVQYLHGGGADSGSGFWVKKASNNETLCHSMDGTDSDTLFEASCGGLAEYSGETVFFQAEDNQNSGWGKVMIDNIRLQDVNNDNLQFCFSTLSPTVLPSVFPTVSPTPSPTMGILPTIFPTESPSEMPTTSNPPSTIPSASPTVSSAKTTSDDILTLSVGAIELLIFLVIFVLIVVLVVAFNVKKNQTKKSAEMAMMIEKNTEMAMMIAEMKMHKENPNPEGAKVEEDHTEMAMPTTF